MHRAEINLVIGEDDRDTEYLFGRISGITVDSTGLIYVSDAQASTIRVFDPDGRYIATVASTGQGPGEVQWPCCLAFDAHGRLWVRDSGNNRYNQYRVRRGSLEFLRQVRMQQSAAGFWTPTSFTPDGHLIDVGPTRPGPGTIMPITSRFYLNDDGSVADSLDIAPPADDRLDIHVSPQGRYIYQPFGSVHKLTNSPTGDYAVAITDRYEVNWYAPDGSLLHTLTRRVEPPPVSPDESRRAAERLNELLATVDLSRADLPFWIPDRKPPLARLYFDATGRLWVQRTATQDERPEADVFDRAGRHLATVQLPQNVNLELGTVTDDTAHGVLRRPGEAERPVRLRSERIIP